MSPENSESESARFEGLSKESKDTRDAGSSVRTTLNTASIRTLGAFHEIPDSLLSPVAGIRLNVRRHDPETETDRPRRIFGVGRSCQPTAGNGGAPPIEVGGSALGIDAIEDGPSQRRSVLRRELRLERRRTDRIAGDPALGTGRLARFGIADEGPAHGMILEASSECRLSIKLYSENGSRQRTTHPLRKGRVNGLHMTVPNFKHQSGFTPAVVIDVGTIEGRQPFREIAEI